MDRYLRAAGEGKPFRFFYGSDNLDRLPQGSAVLKGHSASLIHHCGASTLTIC